MKKCLSILFILFLCPLALSQENEEIKKQNPIKDLKIISDAVPAEFDLMLSHLKVVELTETQIQSIVAASKLISQDLEKVPKANILFLLKSEIYKGILNNQHLNHGDMLQLSPGIMNSVKDKLDKFKVTYTSFVQWLLRSLMTDLEPYLKDKLIDQFQSGKKSDSDKKMKLQKMQKILKYHSSWLQVFDRSEPEALNQLCTDVIIDILESISKKTYYYTTFTGKLETLEGRSLFIIPDIDLTPKKESLPEEKTLKEEAKERKKEAEKIVEGLDSEDMSAASEELDKIESPE